MIIETETYKQNLDFLVGTVIGTWKPPAVLTVTEWAEKNRILSVENCALPGPYRVSITPFIKEPLDVITDPSVEKIVFQKSAQVAWTDGVINNAVGYFIDHDPASMLILFPTESMGKRYSKEKLAPMIRDTRPLRGKVKEAKSRDSGNTILSKNFQGGHIELVGSNSPVNLASSPIRIVIVEEPDRCAANAGGEGNSLKLAFERTKTFFNRRLILGGSPTIKGESEIEREMLLSDQRRFEIPCPHCKKYLILTWSMVIWDKQPGRNHPIYGDRVPESARLRCDHCLKEFSNAEKNRQLSLGRWKPTAEFTGTAGFYINEIYSPFPKATLADMAAKFLEAKLKNDAGDPTLMITFINTALGETWEEKGETVEQRDLIDRLEKYRKDAIDPKILVITAAVDVQDDRLECEIVGWGIGEESFSLEYLSFEGDPELEQVWTDLDSIFERKFRRPDEIELRIACTCIDSGAHTESVYRYVYPRQGRRVYAIKGKSTEGEPIVGRPSKKSLMKGLHLYPIGTDTAKSLIYSRLKIDEPGPGFCHFPDHYPTEYFEQLTSEELVTRYVKGRARRYWKKKRPRNEALDLRVYNMAALIILNPNFEKIKSRMEATARKQPEEKPDARPIVPRKPINRPRKNFVSNY